MDWTKWFHRTKSEPVFIENTDKDFLYSISKLHFFKFFNTSLPDKPWQIVKWQHVAFSYVLWKMWTPASFFTWIKFRTTRETIGNVKIWELETPQPIGDSLPTSVAFVFRNIEYWNNMERCNKVSIASQYCIPGPIKRILWTWKMNLPVQR